MFLIKQRSDVFIFLSSLIVFVSPTWGMEPQDTNPPLVKLVRKKAQHQITKEAKEVVQIIGNDGKPLYDKNLFYEINSLKYYFELIEKDYNAKIKEIRESAYASLKQKLDAEYQDGNTTTIPCIKKIGNSIDIFKNSIDEKAINTLFTNYLDEFNKEKKIDVTGASLTRGEWQDLKKYMKHCSDVYTDCSTRDFITEQHLPSVAEKLDNIILKKVSIENIFYSLSIINERLKISPAINLVFTTSPGICTENRQLPTIEKYLTLEEAEADLSRCMVRANELLFSIKDNTISFENSNKNIYDVHNKLNIIKDKINYQYHWYFENKITWWNTINNTLSFDPIPSHEEHQLTPKAVIASSFLSKLSLLSNDNITILDVGFRNKGSFNNILNTVVVTPIAKLFDNPTSWFDGYGEVDYVAYIERDPNKVKDKLIITYSGSNGFGDWVTNLTIGHDSFYGLPGVHQGICEMFTKSSGTFLSTLSERINEYYKDHRNDQETAELEIVITGHSLGGALAELAAYYCKTQLASKIYHKKISVKVFTFGAPVIMDTASKENIERTLGRNNIYRAWTGNDIIVNWPQLIQDDQHIGKSIVLYNIDNHSTNILGVRDSHQHNVYISYLETSDPETHSEKHKKFTKILNDYIEEKNLDTYKMNLRELRSIRNNLERDYLSNSHDLSETLVRDIVKYYPSPFNLQPNALHQTDISVNALDKGILRYLINFPQKPYSVALEYGAKVAENFKTYHRMTEVIHLEKDHLLNDLINISEIKKLFFGIKEKEKKFDDFRKNLDNTLKEFDSRNTVGNAKIYPYREKMHLFNKYMEDLKQFILNLEWEIQEEVEHNV